LTASRALRLAVAIALTAYVVWANEPRAILAAARRADLGWIGAAIALVLVDRALMAWRWLDLLAALSTDTRPPFRSVLRIFFVSTFVGTFLPSVGGDLYRAYSLSRLDVRLAESAASVLVDRLLGVLSIVLLGGVAAAFAPHLAREPAVVWALVAAGAVCLSAALTIFTDTVAAAVHRLAGVLPQATLERLTRKMIEAVRRYAGHRLELARVLGASVAVQFLRVLQAYCLGRAVGLALPLSVYLVFIPIVLLVMLLPVTINGLGTSQLAFDWLFAPLGVDPAATVALSLLFVALGIVGNLPGAVLYAAGERPRVDRAARESAP
jgi:uncharacterized protein (TIRG00374 family)